MPAMQKALCLPARGPEGILQEVERSWVPSCYKWILAKAGHLSSFPRMRQQGPPEALAVSFHEAMPLKRQGPCSSSLSQRQETLRVEPTHCKGRWNCCVSSTWKDGPEGEWMEVCGEGGSKKKKKIFYVYMWRQASSYAQLRVCGITTVHSTAQHRLWTDPRAVHGRMDNRIRARKRARMCNLFLPWLTSCLTPGKRIQGLITYYSKCARHYPKLIDNQAGNQTNVKRRHQVPTHNPNVGSVRRKPLKHLL